MAEMGRPKIQIDFNEFEKLCTLHCTLIEMAGWFGCCEDTIQKKVKEHYGETFSAVYEQKKGKGKISVRRKQLEVALSGNVTMLIWLGKNMLDQTDKREISGNENKPFTLKYSLDEDDQDEPKEQD